MKANRLILILLSVFLAGLLSACGGAASTAWPGVTVDQDVAYLADGLYVYAVDLKTGKEVARGNEPLRFPQKSSNQVSFFAAPVVTSDGNLLIGSAGHSHNLFSVDPDNFTEDWIFEDAKDIYLGSPLVFGERIYAPNGDGNLYVLDLNGNLLETFDTAGHGLWAAPVTDGETIYLSSLDHNVYAIEPKTLALKWTAELDGAINASPVISEDGHLYVGTLSKTLYAIDMTNGSTLWNRTLDGWLYSSPTLDGDTLYIGAVVGESGGKVYAINAENGSPRWEYVADSAVAGTPLVLDASIVFATESGTVASLDKGGVLQWDETFDHNFYAGAILWDDTVLVAPSQSPILLVALNPDNGTLKWKFEPEN